MRPFALALAAALAPGPALAADALDDCALEVHVGLTTASLLVHLDGDDDGDATAALRWRPAGGAWVEGHPGVRIVGGRLATALFSLAEGTAHTAEITCADPDGGAGDGLVREVALTTRSSAPPPITGATWHVAADGDDGATGDATHPFATIGRAVEAAGPGDAILVGDGLYREEVALDGFAGPLRIASASPFGAVLDGADAELWENPGGDLWEDGGDGTFSAALDRQPGYVAVDGAQLYHYESRADLRSSSEGVHEGWFWDGERLHVRLPDDGDPDDHEVAAGVLGAAFDVERSTGVTIEGFEIRHYGGGDYPKGVYLRSSSGCVVRGNRIHHTAHPVWIRPGDARENLVEGNEIWDTGITSWPWEAVKGSAHETSAVTVQGGEGNVVRQNVLYDMFNGVYVGSFDEDRDESQAPYTDVHDNLIRDIADDPLEPEGACLQVKLFGNRIEHGHQGVSTAPVTVGPLWIHHNSTWQVDGSALKINNAPDGPVLVYHNTFYTDLPETNCLTTGESGWSRFVLRNNVLVGTRYVFEDGHGPGPGNDWDRDLLWTTDPERFVKWDDERYPDLASFRAGTGQEASGLSADPLLLDPATGDLRLTEGSPAVDAGVVIPGIGHVAVGAAPDLGATELGSDGPGPDTGDPDSDSDSDSDSDTDTGPDTDPDEEGGGGGCGCSGAPGGPGLAWALLALVRRRRRAAAGG